MLIPNPLILTLGFGILRRPTSSIPGVVFLREKGLTLIPLTLRPEIDAA